VNTSSGIVCEKTEVVEIKRAKRKLSFQMIFLKGTDVFIVFILGFKIELYGCSGELIPQIAMKTDLKEAKQTGR
jgi:hypothetical protein